MRQLVGFVLTTLFLGTSCDALAAGLEALQVELKYSVAASCHGPLQGLLEGDQITLRARVKNASGSFRYRFWYTNEGFKVKAPMAPHGQTDVSSSNGGSSSQTFRIRQLQDDLSRNHITMGVTVQDARGLAGSAFLRLRVSRPIIFERDEQRPEPACYQTYPPECVSAEYTNQNDTDLKVTVSQVDQQLQDRRFQSGSSWAISPSVFFSGVAISIFSYQWGHFNALAHQSSDSVYLTVENVMNPGDVGSIYRQRTRLMVPYRVSVLDSCRKELFTGYAYLDSWQRSYNLIKKDPLSGKVCDLNNVGAPVINTCAELDKSMVKYQFTADPAGVSGGDRHATKEN